MGGRIPQKAPTHNNKYMIEVPCREQSPQQSPQQWTMRLEAHFPSVEPRMLPFHVADGAPELCLALQGALGGTFVASSSFIFATGPVIAQAERFPMFADAKLQDAVAIAARGIVGGRGDEL